MEEEEIKRASLELHLKNKGKIAINSKISLKTKDDLSLAYTPGVAQPCLEIARNKKAVYDYTSKSNMVAVVTDGSAVLGLGNIGAEASLPVMEGKCILFKEFGNVDAFPIALSTQDPDKVVDIVKNISPMFGGINLEDIKAPECFEIEERLRKELDIPVFHDDQHGTAVVVLAALLNSLKITKRKIEELKVIVNGAGAAGIAITKLLLKSGVKHVTMMDSKGAIYSGRDNLNKYKQEIAESTNLEKEKGVLDQVIKEKDLFIGVSKAGVLTKEMVMTMEKDPIIFAMANPTPEIMYDDAKEAGAKIVGTGRSDMPNQINNLLAFPPLFRGALDARASTINDEMKIAAANAIASIVEEVDLGEENIMPDPLNKNIYISISNSVYDAAFNSGVARLKKDGYRKA